MTADRDEEDILEEKSFGLALMLLRRARGLSLKELAALSGSTRGNLSGYETGRMRPRYETFRRVLRAMDATPVIFNRAQQLVIEASSGRASALVGDPPIETPELPRTHAGALRLARAVGKAVAQATLAFLELRAGGWEELSGGESAEPKETRREVASPER